MRGPIHLLRPGAAIAALLVSIWTLPVLADVAGPSADDIKAAGAEFDLGKQAYKQRSWVEAAEHFEAADQRAPSAVALELAIRSRDKAGQPDRALTLAALALARHPEQEKLVKLAHDVIKKSVADLHKLTVHCTPACDLVVGTKLVHGKSSTERTLYIAAGSTTVGASWSGGRTKSSNVDAVKGGSTELSFEAPPEETAAPAASAEPTKNSKAAPPAAASSPKLEPQHDQLEPSHGWSPAIFFVGAGLTAVAGGVTIWSGIDTKNNPGVDKVRSDCAGQSESCATYQDGLSKQRRTNVLIGVTAGLGVATAVVGAFFTDWSGGHSKARTGWIEPTLGLGSVGARGRF